MVDKDDFKIDSPDFIPVHVTGMVLAGIIAVVVILVLVNMIIAVLTETYARIVVSANTSIDLLKLQSTRFLCILVFWDCSLTNMSL